MNLDTYMDDFGRDLTRAARTRSRRRRRLIRLAPAVPVGAALALALTLAPNGGGSVDAIAAARAALAPEGEIVHMTIRTNGDRGPSMTSEHWTATGPERWRTVHTLPDGHTSQVAYANERLRLYDHRRDVVTILPNAKRATGPALLGGDMTTDLRELLEEGGLRDDGIHTVDGRRVRRLVRELVANDRFTSRFIYLCDPDTFEPISGYVLIGRKGQRPLRGPEFTVTSYERIPLDAQTDDLLKLEKTPDTKYVWR